MPRKMVPQILKQRVDQRQSEREETMLQKIRTYNDIQEPNHNSLMAFYDFGRNN